MLATCGRTSRRSFYWIQGSWREVDLEAARGCHPDEALLLQLERHHLPSLWREGVWLWRGQERVFKGRRSVDRERGSVGRYGGRVANVGGTVERESISVGREGV